MSEHTAGPWKHRHRGSHRFGSDWAIAGPYGAIGYAKLEADARLIAAAPTLLDALRAMLSAFGRLSVADFSDRVSSADIVDMQEAIEEAKAALRRLQEA